MTNKAETLQEIHEFVSALYKSVTGEASCETDNIKDKILAIKEYFENMIALLPGNVYWQDRNNTFLGCNNEQAQNAKLSSRQAIVGKTNHDMIWKDQAEALNTINQQVIRENKTYTVEEVAHMSNGIGVYLSKKVPLTNKQGEVIGILGVSFDITDGKAKETKLLIEAKTAAEQANKAKTQFIANMSHDFRTPLTGIIGLSELLLKDIQIVQREQYLVQICKSSKTLLSLFNEIIQMVKMTNDQNQQQREIFNIPNMLGNLVSLLQPSLVLKEIQLEQQLDLPYGDLAKGHHIAISRILLNILTNAIKFTQQGTITLHVSQTVSMQGKWVLRVAIADSGIGMSQEQVKLIFQPFERLSPAYQGLYKGMGIGLYVSKQYATTIGADIEVSSEPGQGSCFTVTIPLEPVDADDIDRMGGDTGRVLSSEDIGVDLYQLHEHLKVTPQLASIQKNTGDASQTQATGKPQKNQGAVAVNESYDKNAAERKKVLVVEDTKVQQLMVQKILEDQGCQVDMASDSQQALQKFQNNRYDIILMDIGLPDRDGCDTTRMMRDIEKQKNSVATPIIALTAHVDETTQQHYLAAGLTQVCFKPLTSELTQEILARFLPVV